MDTQNTFATSAQGNSASNMDSHNNQPLNQNKAPSPVSQSLVPKGITIGLVILALILSLAGYGARMIAGHDTAEVLRHAAVLVPAFIIGIPLLFWIGSRIFNKMKGTHIHAWNAVSLGYLTSCISLLWLMGTYS